MPDTPESTVVPSKDADKAFTPWIFGCLLALMIGVMFPRVITGQESFFYRDFGLFTHPVAQYQRECFWRGEMPLWNPYNNFGVPFLAQWNTSSLYPPILFYLVLPLPWSLAIFNLGHLVLAGLGMYFLARRWTGNPLAASVAGLAFACNGLSWHMLMWVSNLAAYAWMPWVVLAVERAWREGGRRIILAALVAGLQMLSGAPEIILLTWVFLAALLAAELFKGAQRGNTILRFAAVPILVAGLSAAQLLPFMDLLAHCHRDAGYAGSEWAMPGWGWANFIVPLFHSSPSIIGVYSQNEQQWASSYYAGISVLALAVMALWPRRNGRIYLLAAAALLGVLLSMGDQGFLLAGLKRVMPGVGIMRYPIKMIVLTVFALPLLAAFGMNELLRAQGAARRAISWRTLAITGVLLIALAGILSHARQFPKPDDSWPVTLESGSSRAVFLVVILAAAWLLPKARTQRMAALAGVTVLLLVGLDAMTHSANQNPTVSSAAYGPLGIEKDVTARLGEARAMVDPRLQRFLQHASTTNTFVYFAGQRSALFLDCNVPERIPTTSGFFSLYLREPNKVESVLNDPAAPTPGPLADFVGVSQISSPDMPVSWTNRPGRMPLITAGQRAVFAGPEETFKSITSPDFDPRTTVYLPEEARGTAATNASAPKISAQQFSAQRMNFVVEAGEAATVVVAQAFYHPWRAYVDGNPVPLWKANYAFQALGIPAGRHEVKLVYSDRKFQIGAAISLATLVLCAVGWIRLKKPASR